MHDALAAKLPLDKLTEDEPPTAVAVPPQVLLRLGVEAIVRPAGRLSVNAIPVSATNPFGFWMVKVSEVVPLSGTLAAPNNLVMAGGAATVRFAVLLAGPVAPMPLVVEVIAPAPETVLL